ncbi:MAG: cupin domain-containing protein [Candidatus Binatia bacterium]
MRRESGILTLAARLKPRAYLAMKLIKINSALKRLKKLSDEIRYADCFSAKQFTSGLIAFRRHKSGDPKQIEHADKDVVCQVIKGSGRLRVGGKRLALRAGVICHIPKGTPHDFAAGKAGELVLFYSLIKTG